MTHAFSGGDYEEAYRKIRENESQARNILLDFGKVYPGEMKGENINAILEQARQKLEKDKGR